MAYLHGFSIGELTLGQALQSRQSLTTVPLLDTDVDVILLGPNFLCLGERVTLVCEGICVGSTRVCQSHARHRWRRGGVGNVARTLTESSKVLHVHATNVGCE